MKADSHHILDIDFWGRALDTPSGEIVGKALEKGLLINAVRPNMIRFMPPLNVSKDEIDQAVKVIDEILEESK